MLDFEARGKPEYPEKTPMCRVDNKQTLSLDPHMTPGLVLEPAGYIGARWVFSTLHQPYTHWLSRSPATRNGRPKTEFFFSIWCLAPANCVWRIGGGASPRVIMLTIYSNKQQRNGCHTYRFPPSVFGSGWLLCRLYRHHHHYKSWAYMADEKRYKSDELITVTQMDTAKLQYKWSDHFWWFVGKLEEPAEKSLGAE